MNKIPIQQRGLAASRLVLGCMGLGGGWNDEPITEMHLAAAHAAVEAALEAGINMFDHADIYTRGKAEQVFGQVLKERPELRERIVLQSKCGIRFADNGIPGRYDFSKEHILRSVDGSLQRLGVEYLDILLFHRPDPLMEPEEVAEAMSALKSAGKVRAFGVSNMSAGQIRLLQTYSKEPFIVNQLEMSLAKIGWLDQSVHVNQNAAKEDTFPEGTLEYCRLENIQIQAWAPLAQGVFSGRDLSDLPASIRETAGLVQAMANEKDTTPEAIILAWLMRHPAGIQPVIGTANPERIRACGEAVNITLTREEWYTLYVSSRGRALP
ncbi:aldo/keto reductase [Paenibacillus thiaminolyticus]|uniref:Aldo/keto reductase n=1 Tax=Paenibacillus thiaminolyticus TaxID=49283 RepID=A0AAP9DZ83_PANTH|nr:aldo/keto reductase [Paenibacillus thiaminolyticus]MCY9535902.1 aldo/keto reductase [Paenibacillus thiaminolyticus]MCY9603066.1 aldo/keto reductase [Paenibacillus thiaminolyticus]MCY9607896.1 aldo/keto reductase [Paenibacillus thiaminolyticus]MCY9611666.1 aldo/keto reductase [Paenibacillus thiaminolyticus]MCY9618675.1 aldo/keto reductase [Paenibacillus thiaminolyticus]